jgi:hypothetical protein
MVEVLRRHGQPIGRALAAVQAAARAAMVLPSAKPECGMAPAME